MPTPEQTHVETLLSAADRDMGVAQVLLQNAAHYYENIGFSCQQAVEKYLKAVLISAELPAPYIHNLVLLIEPLQLAGIIQVSAQELGEAAALNEFAVALRYETDESPDYTSADLLAMATHFQTKLRPLAQAFLI